MDTDYGMNEGFYFKPRKEFQRFCREILTNADVRRGMLYGLSVGYHSVSLHPKFKPTTDPKLVPFVVTCRMKCERRYAIGDATIDASPTRRLFEVDPFRVSSRVLFGELQAFEPAPRPARGAKFEVLDVYRVYFPNDDACYPQVELGELWYYFDIRKELERGITKTRRRGIIRYNVKRILQFEREVQAHYASVRSGTVRLLTKPWETGQDHPRHFSNKDRMAIFQRDGFKCVICGRDAEAGATLEVDHVIPWSNRGRSNVLNGRTLCRDCNIGSYYTDSRSEK